MISHATNLRKRITVGLLWAIGLIALVLGRRIFHAMNNPDYDVAWFVYVFVGVTSLLFVLPRIFTATSITITPETTTLGYWMTADRAYRSSSISLQTQNRSLIVIDGITLDGKHIRSILFASGFEKKDWREIVMGLQLPESNQQQPTILD